MTAVRSLPEAELHRLGYEPVLVPQGLYEYWVVAARPRSANGLRMTTPQADVTAAQWTDLFRLIRDERGVYTHGRSRVVAEVC